MYQINLSDLVRSTSQSALAASNHVQINQSKLQEFSSLLSSSFSYPDWNLFEGHIKNIDFVFALDSLNFCFWPLSVQKQGQKCQFEYEDLCRGLGQLFKQDSKKFKPQGLANWTKEDLEIVLCQNNQNTDPLFTQRLSIIQQTGWVFNQFYSNSYELFIQQSNASCQNLLQRLQIVMGFQDNCIHPLSGEQIHFYKRGQILCCDLQESQLCSFNDIDKLTVFADYRVPQLLNQLSILNYSPQLQSQIDSKEVISAGSLYEIEIRSATVQAVEQLKEISKLPSYRIDQYLWNTGEQIKDQIKNHHRTLTIFY